MLFGSRWINFGSETIGELPWDENLLDFEMRKKIVVLEV